MQMIRMLSSFVVLVAIAAAGVPAHAAQAQSKSSGRPAAKPAVAGTIKINTASASDLGALPGIGAKPAQRIVEYRQKNGPPSRRSRSRESCAVLDRRTS
jgi:DNA uptake protein ComE-like DNA-binding protein